MERVKKLVDDLTRRGFIPESKDETTGWIIRSQIESIINEAIDEDRDRTAMIIAAVGDKLPSHKLNEKIMALGNRS